MKIELPAKLTDRHHLLFSFYQISCQKPKPGEPLIQEPTFLGCTVSSHDSTQLALVVLAITPPPLPPPPPSPLPSLLPCHSSLQWIPFRDGKVELGDFNLCVTADRPPHAYSQLSSDVALPNLKWIDGHKPVFKVSLSMVSSIHPQVGIN